MKLGLSSTCCRAVEYVWYFLSLYYFFLIWIFAKTSDHYLLTTLYLKILSVPKTASTWYSPNLHGFALKMVNMYLLTYLIKWHNDGGDWNFAQIEMGGK